MSYVIDKECTLNNCPVCDRSSPVERLCQPCHTSVVTMIQDLPELWLEAHDELEPGKNGKGGSSNEPSLGVNVAALSLIAGDDILRLFHKYERLIRKSRNLTPPALLAKKPLTEEIANAVSFATRHLDYSSSQPWINEFVAELKVLHRSARSAARKFSDPVRRISCPGDTSEGLPCGVHITLRSDDMLAIFTCKRCKTEWSSMRLVAVALASPTGKFWVDVEAAATWLALSERRVQQIVKENKIDRQGLLIDLKAVMAAR